MPGKQPAHHTCYLTTRSPITANWRQLPSVRQKLLAFPLTLAVHRQPQAPTTNRVLDFHQLKETPTHLCPTLAPFPPAPRCD